MPELESESSSSESKSETEADTRGGRLLSLSSLSLLWPEGGRQRCAWGETSALLVHMVLLTEDVPMRQELRCALVRLLPVVQSVGPVLLLPVLLLHLRVLMGELALVLHRERIHVLLRDVRREVWALRKV